MKRYTTKEFEHWWKTDAIIPNLEDSGLKKLAWKAWLEGAIIGYDNGYSDAKNGE